VATRLTELLERIRPSGAPGAAAIGEPAVDAAAEELTELTRVLASIEAEADRLIDEARAHVDRLHHDADLEAQRIRAGVAERVALAQTEVDTEHEDRGAAESRRIVESATREADRRREIAAAQLDALAASAIDHIWQLAGTERGQSS
jgi:vacuolar-type H+-ATPase subunit H